MTIDDISSQHGNILPLGQLGKTTYHCIKKILIEASRNGIPRIKRFEEEPMWPNTNVLESLEDLKKGKSNAVAAISKVTELIKHKNVRVSEAAKNTLLELRKYA